MTEVTVYQPNAITTTGPMHQAGQAANHSAEQHVFDDYLSRKALNTLKAQAFDLAVFSDYLGIAGVNSSADDLQSDPDAWQGMTWGLVEGFVKWMLLQGFSIGTLNRRLSTVKVYAKLAAKSGAIGTQEHAMIRLVSGYAGKEAKRVNEKRAVTRVGHKKAAHTSLSAEQSQQLKAQPDSPQGRRDAVIMALLLDLGLRVGEVAILEVAHVNLKEGTLQVYRPKVDVQQTHKLSADCLIALRNWIDSGDCGPFGPLLRGSRKGGELTEAGMSTTSISDRVRTLGKEIGVNGLSAHDCRHYWTSHHVGGGAALNQVRQAGGWSTLTMVQRYAEDSKIANEGLV